MSKLDPQAADEGIVRIAASDDFGGIKCESRDICRKGLS